MSKAERFKMYWMKGELRWIEMKDLAEQRSFLSHSKKLEDECIQRMKDSRRKSEDKRIARMCGSE